MTKFCLPNLKLFLKLDASVCFYYLIKFYIIELLWMLSTLIEKPNFFPEFSKW